MALVQAGSVEAFGELYDHYCDRAYRVALAICRDSASAEDAVQEAFLSVWRGRAGYLPERGTVAVWLMGTVRNRALDTWRRDARHGTRRASQDMLGELPASRENPDRCLAGEDAERLKGLLLELPLAQREVIALAFYGQLSHREIAARLDVPPGTVKSRMRLGLCKLRGGFGHDGLQALRST